jgi:UPF0755 protein
MKKKLKRKLYNFRHACFILIILCASIFVFPGPSSIDTRIEIKQGDSAQIIVSKLKQANIIYSEYLLLGIIKLFNLDKYFIFGEFNIKAHISIANLLYYISDSKNVISYKITIIEGMTVRQALLIIKNEPNLKGEITISPKEGTLMPDTYYFTKKDTKNSIIIRMQNSMSNYLDMLWEKRDPKLPYKNKQEALILASLVEKESAHPDEREIIAAVFLNRLRIGMKLQTDPTVAYGLGKDSANKLTKSDLQANHPHNTYVYYGLPPTPIANPSKRALRAVFYPAQTKYLYFVADGKGGHIFANTLKEHNMNVIRWREIEKEIRKKEREQTNKK